MYYIYIYTNIYIYIYIHLYIYIYIGAPFVFLQVSDVEHDLRSSESNLKLDAINERPQWRPRPRPRFRRAFKRMLEPEKDEGHGWYPKIISGGGSMEKPSGLGYPYFLLVETSP